LTAAGVPPRRVSLVVVGDEGRVLGRLPEFPVSTPWWQEVRPVVEGARDRFGLDCVVLRLFDSELPRPQGGGVMYVAQATEPLPATVQAVLEPFDGVLPDDSLRLRWAQPGGPGADLAWAEDVLRARRLERVGPPEQLRSWNLSSIWRLPLAGGAAWLKVVPPFFAHEGDILRRLQGGPVPRLLGHDGDRVLLADIPGADQYDAELPELLEIGSALVDMQAAWIGREDELLGIGLPDWRWRQLALAIEDVVARRAANVPEEVRSALGAFVSGLQARFEHIDACGLPTTFVHGDFHPGNVRGGEGMAPTILDWGDCGVGNPLLDLSAFLGRVPQESAPVVRAHWAAEWRRHVPASDPLLAAQLIGPVAAARQAVMYQLFLDRLEPVERRYHDADVPEWLARIASLMLLEAAPVG
jgi:hypothetical protein